VVREWPSPHILKSPLVGTLLLVHAIGGPTIAAVGWCHNLQMGTSKINLRQILSSKKPKVKNTTFIAVDGRGGSGKSTLAKWLSEKLNASIVRTDDFASWENMFDWWPLVIELVFEPIKNGATSLNYGRSKWWENQHPEPAISQPVTAVMILEGVSSSRREFRNYISLSIFVDTPKKLCLQRGIERDASTGKTIDELNLMWERWFEEEDSYMRRDQSKDHADIVIDGTNPFEEQVTVDLA
jgi:uridine kinase